VALDGGEGSSSRSARFTPGEIIPVPIWQKARQSQSGSGRGGEEKIPAQSLYWLSYTWSSLCIMKEPESAWYNGGSVTERDKCNGNLLDVTSYCLIGK